MGVNNLAEYVKFHQEKLRQQEARAASTSTTPTSQSTSTSTNTRTKSKGGVNHLHSMSSFKTSVIEGSSDKIVVVDFFATWCGPCKAIAPTIVNMSNEQAYADRVSFVKIDVDEASDVAQEQGIRAMPTFGIFKNGEKVDEVVGADARSLRTKIDALL